MCISSKDNGRSNQFRSMLLKLLVIIGFLLLLILIAVIIITLTPHHSDDSDLIVELPTGKVKGRHDISLKRNVTFYSFLQIPYGQPPIEKLRFMSPKPVEKWEGVLDCTKETKICFQENRDDERENEDCLYVNVYSPVKPGSNSSLPVMFYIFGNAFCCKSVEFARYGPHFFMEEGVIIVTFSYRIGPFGFLSTNDEVVLGNVGLKDQNLALKWTNENIHLFGGDPKKITIFGKSSGSGSTSFQVLSKKSAGLFRAAICQSGSAINQWAIQRHARSIAYQLATFIDPYFNINSSSQELLNFLQNVDARTLDHASTQLKDYLQVYPNDYIIQGPYFGPVIEPDVDDAYISEKMYQSFATGDFNQVPFMTGINSEEGLFYVVVVDDFEKMVERYEEDPTELFLSRSFNIEDKHQKELVYNLSRQIYTNELLTNDLSAAVQYFSDNSYSRAVIRAAELQSKYTDVYFYQFSYHGPLSRNYIYFDGTGRVGHSGDDNYAWCAKNISNLQEYYPQSDITTLERYVRLLTNFAKCLNPTPKSDDLLQNITWPKLQSNKFQYLNIDNNLEIKLNPRETFYSKWSELFEKYAVKPYDTF